MRHFALLLLLASAACPASTLRLQRVSSGHVGCSPDAIQIADYKLGVTTSSWTAACDGTKYFCTGSDTLKGVACSKGR